MFAKPQAKNSDFKVSRHFVFIEAPIEIVGPAAIFWGDADWWPAKCALKFIRTSDGGLALGETHDLRFAAPFPMVWKTEVTKLVPGQLVERVFRRGIFRGSETVRVEERANGTRVEYELNYSIPNLFNAILWNLLFSKQHSGNIEKVLAALKDYCVKKAETGLS